MRRAVETDVRPWLALFDEAVSWLVASGREGQRAPSRCRRGNEARQRGVEQVRLDCWAGGDGALVRYYERLGFQRGDPLQVGAWSGQLMTYAL